jgi:arylsulfatase A-like enzyme
VLEAGGKFVTVFWDEYGLFNTGWDTHVHHYPRLKTELGPGLDAAFTSLLADLDARGMLDDTAVLVLSEHGRTPRLQNVKGGGRDHWASAYSAAFAGGGFARGRVIGRTDRHGGTVSETPFSPKDVLATLYHLLGIDPHTEIRDRLGRPLPVGGEGRVRAELLE